MSSPTRRSLAGAFAAATLLLWCLLPNIASAATTTDWTGQTFNQSNCEGIVKRITGSDNIVKGGRFIGNDSGMTWRECKGPNGMGINDNGSGNGRYTGQFMSRIGTDSWRVVSEAHDSIVWDHVQTEYGFDDAFSIGRKSNAKFTVINSYLDGYALWATRNTGGDGNPYTLTMDGVIFRQRYNPSSESGRKCGNVFKLDGFQGDSSHPWLIQNSVFYIPSNVDCGTDTPSNTTWRNVTFVWAGSGSFPYWNGGSSAPSGVTVTTNTAAFTNAVNAFNSGGGPTPTSTATSTVSPSPSPSPTSTTPGTVTFNATQDSWLDKLSSGTNHGTDTSLYIDNNSLDDRRRAILQFDPDGLAGRPVTSAKLRLYATDGASSNTAGDLQNLGNAAWAENSVTYSNQPAVASGNVTVAGKSNPAANTWVEWDVTSIIQKSLDSPVSFRIDPTGSDGLTFAARENGTVANRPQLVIGLAGGTSPPPTSPVPTPSGSENCTQDDVQTAISGISAADVSSLLTTLAPNGTNRSAGNARLQQMVDWYATTMGGYGMSTKQQAFTNAGATQHNAVASITGYGTDRYAVAAHIDSVSAGPGADDNGSGVVATMVAAKALASLPAACFKASVDFVATNAEENSQPPIGATTYGASVKDNIKGIFNLDMVGNGAGNGSIVSDYNSSNSGGQALAQLVASAKTKYGVTGLTLNVGTYSASDTDTISWWNQGIPAINVMEAVTSPNYHQSSDTVANVNTTQIAKTAQSVAGAVADLSIDTSGTGGGPAGYITVAAAGDIVCQASNPGSDPCKDAETAAKVTAMNPDAVLALGDLQYEDGSLTQFNAAYANTWGVTGIKSKTLPVPGNHEWNTANAGGYFDYWDGAGVNNGVAGERGKGWHATTVGNWLLIGLDSDHAIYEDSHNAEQLTWFQGQLADNRASATPKPVLVYWHHPRWTAGGDHGNEPTLEPYWNAMVADPYVQAELHGHVHKEEWLGRLNASGQQSATGVASFGLGTGGKNLDQLPKQFSTGIPALSENMGTGGDFGVGKFRLYTDGRIRYDFVSIETTGVYTDSVDLPAKQPITPPTSPGPTPSQTVTPVPTTTDVPGSITFGADADSFVRSDSTTRNFGTEPVVSVQGTAPSRRAFIRFDPNGLAGKTITKATLRLKVADASNYTGQVKKITTGDWTETGLTWDNQPTAVSTGSAEAESDTTATLGEWVTFDVTQFLGTNPDDPINLRITHTGSDILKYASREAVDPSTRPQLVVDYTTQSPTTVPSTIIITPTPTGTSTAPPGEADVLGSKFAREGEALDPSGDYSYRNGTAMVYVILRAPASAAQAAWLKQQLADTNGYPATVVFLKGVPTVSWWDYHLALDDLDVRSVIFNGNAWDQTAAPPVGGDPGGG